MPSFWKERWFLSALSAAYLTSALVFLPKIVEAGFPKSLLKVFYLFGKDIRYSTQLPNKRNSLIYGINP
jgi:hypothetical protein